MVATRSLRDRDARRYLLASLSVQWRFRRLGPPSGLLLSRPVAAQEECMTAAGSLREQQFTKFYRRQR